MLFQIVGALKAFPTVGHHAHETWPFMVDRFHVPIEVRNLVPWTASELSSTVLTEGCMWMSFRMTLVFGWRSMRCVRDRRGSVQSSWPRETDPAGNTMAN